MNFNEIKYSLYKLMPWAAKWDVKWLLLVALVVIVAVVILSGKKLKFRIPFLPRSMGQFSIDKESLKGLGDKFSRGSGEESQDGEEATAETRSARSSGGFIGAISLLSGRHNKRYEVPTYLVIGGNSDLNKALSKLDSGRRQRLLLQKHKQLGSKNWFIFNRGCLVTYAEGDAILATLNHYRPERPIDGLVVYVTVEQLTGQDAAQHADRIYQELWQVQNKLDFVLPVYLLVGEGQNISGFADFWRQDHLSEHSSDMFGWSVPYGELEVFEAGWIHQAFKELVERLRKLQLMVIRQGCPGDGPAASFIAHFDKLNKPLQAFCSTLFNPSQYHEAFQFRGFYFTGRLAKDEVQGAAFLDDLFDYKVFSESNLAYPKRGKLLSSNRQLRLYQYLCAAALVTLGGFFSFDVIELNKQRHNLVEAIETIPKSQNGADIQYVNQVLDHVSSMDAQLLFYGSIPWSWENSFDDKLINFFAKNIFADIIFPAFECRLEHVRQSQLNEPTLVSGGVDFIEWLKGLDKTVAMRNSLESLVTGTVSDHKAIAAEFTALVEYLYHAKLPDSFYHKSELYFAAIAQQGEIKHDSNRFCQVKTLNNEALWKSTVGQSNEFSAQVAKEVAAPLAFFRQLLAVASLPAGSSWYTELPDFAEGMAAYTHWSREMQLKWLSGHEVPNHCQSLQKTLDSLGGNLKIDHKDTQLKNVTARCSQSVRDQLALDNEQLNGDLYRFNLEEPDTFMFSERSNRLFAELNKLTVLSFMAQRERSGDDGVAGLDFFWSVDKLNHAMETFNEYKVFAEANYDGLALPQGASHDEGDHSYLAQAVALKQLQLTMAQYIHQARQQQQLNYRPQGLRPVSQQEAELAARISNFKQAMTAMISLSRTFDQLDFADTRHWFLALAQQHAYHLLEKVDQLYRDNRLYQPLPYPIWGAHQYTDVLFGISSEGQLKDYLAAQMERSQFIASNYAEPLIVFLMNTQGKYVNYELFGKWKNTLVEINKMQNQDPSNSQGQLELFFNNQLLTLDQSNCFKRSQEMISPGGSDLFAISQRLIVSKAKKHCTSFRADIIKKEYLALSTLFSDTLANKYPFTRFDKAQQASPAAIKQFLKQYPGKASGLADRMEVLAWKDASYQEALHFVRQLDTSLALLSAILTASEGAQAQGIELKAEFNVRQDIAQNFSHITDWRLATDNDYRLYPGGNESLFWLPNQPLSLTLNWAKNSPYSATAMNGENRGSNSLIYEASGFWSLLRFIQNYRAVVADNNALDPSAELLTFGARISTRNGQAELPQKYTRAYLRLTLYGLDPENKEKIALAIPDNFPSAAPKTPELTASIKKDNLL